jgi:eukaryotic-like serine/threonine-protein kinase
MAIEMPKKTKPWQEKWVETGVLSEGGGQGKIFFVARTGDLSGKDRFALKELKSQKDPERRARMHREVAALQTLDHSGIPRFIDSNAEQFKDLSVPLFLVTDYVDGPTLEQYSQGTPVDPGLAIGCILKILDIIDYCHSRGIVHRDIKPANVILRARDPLKPVLLDFGLSFNEDDVSENVTWTGQELGNRFLHLPELQHPGLGQRDRRADLTQCCAILLYLVTGEIPRTLRDKDGLKPHLRQKALNILNALEPATRDCLYALFERGFEHEIDRRVQTADEMRQFLMDTTAESNSDRAEAVKIGRIKAAIGLDEIHQRQSKYLFLLEKTGRIIDQTSRDVAAELFGEDARVANEQSLDSANLRLSAVTGLSHRSQPDKASKTNFLAAITESQLTVTAHDETGWSRSILSSSIAGPTDWPGLAGSLRKFHLDRIDDLHSGRIPTRLTQPLPGPRPTPFSHSEMSSLLSQLPLRAIVAFAARCARRVQAAVRFPEDGETNHIHIENIERAILSAERYARGDATAAAGDHLQNVLVAVTAATIFPAGNAKPNFTGSDAVLAAHNAAAAAIFARQNDPAATVSSAAQAYMYACRVAPSSYLAATEDLRRILTSDLGQHPHLGLPIDPAEAGPLGPVWRVAPARGL